MMNVEKFREAARLIQEGHRLLEHGEFAYYLVEFSAAYDLLMTRFAPFRSGDRARLIQAPDFDLAPSWLHSKHFLVAGAMCKVVEAKCGSRGFTFGVTFDDESWIDSCGEKHPRPHAYVYTFREKELAAP